MCDRRQKEIEEIKDYFKQLGLKDWELRGNYNYGGQANIIEVKRISDSQYGVFRKLKRLEEVDIKRFYRELDILTKAEFKHPNIVEILEYTRDEKNQWYISKKGKKFDVYWKFLKNTHSPDQIALKAIEIIKGLSSGLIKLHQKKVVHRDIKIDNVIMSGDTPQLIDFGIAYIDDEDRITPLSEAAANKVSHQLQLERGDVPPWLDIFLLSQLLISMVAKRPVKNWQRPLDWRWIVFPEEMDSQIQSKIKAILAVCSNPYTSPPNAEKLIALIDYLFYEKTVLAMEEPDVEKIVESILSGEANNIARYSSDREMFNSQAELFVLVAKKIEETIWSCYIKLKENKKLPIEGSRKNINEWVEDVLAAKLEDIQHKTTFDSAIRIVCGDTRKNQNPFYIGLTYHFRMSGQENIGTHCFILQLNLADTIDGFGSIVDKTNYCFLFKDGKFYEYDWTKTGQEFGHDQIIKIVINWLKNNKLWETIIKR